MSYLPLKTNVGVLVGDIYIQPDGAPRPYSFGYSNGATFQPNVESEDIYFPVDGKRTKIGSRTKAISATINLSMGELRPDVVSAAAQGTLGEYTQAAVVAATATFSNVKPGELLDLGVLDVSAVSLTDGEDPLVENVNHRLFAASGSILMLTEQETVEVTYSAPAIASSANRALIRVLTSAQGLRGTLTIIGRNQEGRRYKIVGMRVALRPSGDFSLAGDGDGLQNIELSGDVELNEADPDAPFGRFIELA